MGKFLVIDCESVGLYGESFAVGYVLCDRSGQTLNEGLIATDVWRASGVFEDYEWIKNNVNLEVPQGLPSCKTESLWEIREIFWELWIKFNRQGALLAASHPFPVEALFIADVIKQNLYQRRWGGPYPFIDISTLLVACNKNPIHEFERLENELPKYNPLMNARQSARIMINCFNQLKIFE